MQNHFELFQLPCQFALDRAALDQAYREIQRRVHPDRFVSASESEQRAATQWATQTNEAYQTLKNPVKRAAYLCELNGIDWEVENKTPLSFSFLSEQLSWREDLDAATQARNEAALNSLQSILSAARKTHNEEMAALISQADWQQAAQCVRQAIFLEKFGEALNAAYEAIEDV